MQAHLSLEELSDLVDDQAGDDARAHVDGCESCSNAVARLRAAQAFVAEEVNLPPGVVDAAVAAGVAAMGPSNVVSLSDRRRNPLPWIAGVAAVLVGVLGLAALVNGGAGRDGADTFATGSADDDSAAVAEDAVREEGATGSGGAASGGGGAEGLSRQDAGADEGGIAAPAPAPQRSFSTEEEVFDYLQRSADAMSTTATACSAEATAVLGAPLEALRSEDVIWQDGPAALWVDPARRRAILMRPGGCSPLADLRY